MKPKNVLPYFRLAFKFGRFKIDLNWNLQYSYLLKKWNIDSTYNSSKIRQIRNAKKKCGNLKTKFKIVHFSKNPSTEIQLLPKMSYFIQNSILYHFGCRNSTKLSFFCENIGVTSSKIPYLLLMYHLFLNYWFSI